MQRKLQAMLRIVCLNFVKHGLWKIPKYLSIELLVTTVKNILFSIYFFSLLFVLNYSFVRSWPSYRISKILNKANSIYGRGGRRILLRTIYAKHNNRKGSQNKQRTNTQPIFYWISFSVIEIPEKFKTTFCYTNKTI